MHALASGFLLNVMWVRFISSVMCGHRGCVLSAV